MKNIFLFLLCLTFLLISCTTENDFEKENKQLKEELAAEKGKTVIDIRVEGDQMVLVYSTGATETVPLSDALKGVEGTPGNDGIGIESITYDEETGILTITLTNGNETKFKLTATVDGWVATYLEDVHGKLFITEAMLGAVPVIKAEYNDEYQLTYLENNIVSDMAVTKNWSIIKQFENGKLIKSFHNTYATTDQVAYTQEHFDNDWEVVEFTEYKGDVFKEDNGDGTFTVYSYYGGDGDEIYFYRVISNCILKGPNDYNYYHDSDYYIIRKIDDNVFEYYYSVYEFTNSDNEREVWYRPQWRTTITGVLQKGDIASTKVVQVETNAEGLISKAFEAIAEDADPTQYITYEYNSLGKVTASKTYYKTESGDWNPTGNFNTYTYDANNNLISTMRTYADGSTQEVQRAAYDKNGNPTEIWAYQDAVYEYGGGLNPETGQDGWRPKLIKEAGLYHIATIEYDYKFKNFLGNTVSALLPALENYRIVNAIKNVTATNSYTFANIEYKEFDEYGYPRKMTMNGSGAKTYGYQSVYESVYYELKLRYLIKDK